MLAPQPYLVFNQLVEGAPAPQPTAVHGALVADFFMLAGMPGMAELRLAPEMDLGFLVSCARLPAHEEMMTLLRSDLPDEASAAPLIIAPAGTEACHIVYSHGQDARYGVGSAVKLDSLRLQGHQLIRVAPYQPGSI